MDAVITAKDVQDFCRFQVPADAEFRYVTPEKPFEVRNLHHYCSTETYFFARFWVNDGQLPEHFQNNTYQANVYLSNGRLRVRVFFYIENEVVEDVTEHFHLGKLLGRLKAATEKTELDYTESYEGLDLLASQKALIYQG